jgi:hypothetical protein
MLFKPGVSLKPAHQGHAQPGFWYKKGCQTLFQLLVLVVQQLQGVPAQQRVAFLHSPAGNTVLHVLMDLLAEEEAMMDLGQVVAGAGLQVPEGVQHLQQQLVAGNSQASKLDGLSMIVQLLLPGLLLQPAFAPPVCEGDAGGCSSGNGSPGPSPSPNGSSTSSTTGSSSSKCVVATIGPGEVT